MWIGELTDLISKEKTKQTLRGQQALTAATLVWIGETISGIKDSKVDTNIKAEKVGHQKLMMNDSRGLDSTVTF